MRVRDIMIQDVYVAHERDVVRDVLKQFSMRRIGGMPIVSDDSRLVGYISDGDVMRALGKHYDMGPYLAFGAYFFPVDIDTFEGSDIDSDSLRDNVLQVCAKNVMDIGRKRVISVSEDDDVVHVAELLAKKNIKKVPVVKEGKLVGIVSRGDVVRAVVQKFVTA